ncbi:Kelch repeat-containing protein [Paraglaciecola aestuariivivens]
MFSLSPYRALTVALSLLVFSTFSHSSAPYTPPQLVKKPSSIKLNTARFGHVAVNDSKRIFVMGGRSLDGAYLTDIEVIDPVANTVTTLEDKLIGRRYATAVFDGDRSIYLFGGTTRIKRAMTLEHRVEKIDTQTFEVSIVTEMPWPRKSASANMLAHYVVISGGSKFDRKRSKKMLATSTVGIYDSKNNRWLEGADMPTEKETKTVMVNNLIYALGGYNMRQTLPALERFNLSTNQWQKLPALPREMSAHSVASLGNHIFTFGDYRQLNVHYHLDLNTGTWQELDIGFTPSRHSAATTLNDTIYVIGGTTGTAGATLDEIQQFSFQATKSAQ